MIFQTLTPGFAHKVEDPIVKENQKLIHKIVDLVKNKHIKGCEYRLEDGEEKAYCQNFDNEGSYFTMEIEGKKVGYVSILLFNDNESMIIIDGGNGYYNIGKIDKPKDMVNFHKGNFGMIYKAIGNGGIEIKAFGTKMRGETLPEGITSENNLYNKALNNIYKTLNK